jgi:hypothetical protein
MTIEHTMSGLMVLVVGSCAAMFVGPAMGSELTTTVGFLAFATSPVSLIVAAMFTK